MTESFVCRSEEMGGLPWLWFTGSRKITIIISTNPVISSSLWTLWSRGTTRTSRMRTGGVKRTRSRCNWFCMSRHTCRASIRVWEKLVWFSYALNYNVLCIPLLLHGWKSHRTQAHCHLPPSLREDRALSYLASELQVRAQEYWPIRSTELGAWLPTCSL